jgi:hypothetical protein
MHTSGGRVSTVINGVQFSSRNANIKLDPSNMNVSVASNGDGTNYRTVEATPRTAEISFDRLVDYNGTPLKWDESVMRMVNMSVTFVEQDTNITHLLTNACFTGKPSLDMGTGEISGVGIAADTYETIR